jgi:signal transduction histidine kinase
VLLERLRGLLAAKERLVHALQHELTTPIHGMMGE